MLSVGSLKDWLNQFPDDARIEATDFQDNVVKVDLKIVVYHPGEGTTVSTIGVE
jgi:hypothetical protein